MIDFPRCAEAYFFVCKHPHADKGNALDNGCARDTHTGLAGRTDQTFYPHRAQNGARLGASSWSTDGSAPILPRRKRLPSLSASSTGGIVGGDELHIAVTLDENSHALITQPGAGKFYRSRGPQALLRQHFTLTLTRRWSGCRRIRSSSRCQRRYSDRLSSDIRKPPAGLGSAVSWPTGYAGDLQLRHAAKPPGSVRMGSHC